MVYLLGPGLGDPLPEDLENKNCRGGRTPPHETPRPAARLVPAAPVSNGWLARSFPLILSLALTAREQGSGAGGWLLSLGQAPFGITSGGLHVRDAAVNPLPSLRCALVREIWLHGRGICRYFWQRDEFFYASSDALVKIP